MKGFNSRFAHRIAWLLLAMLAGVVLAGAAPAAEPAIEPDPASLDPAARGAYILRAAGCATCHTDVAGGGAFLAGGRMLSSPWGAIAAPNITPDPETGIGRWSDEDFVCVMANRPRAAPTIRRFRIPRTPA